MSLCPRCKHHFRTLPDEGNDHPCPRCGLSPWDVLCNGRDDLEEDDEDDDDDDDWDDDDDTETDRHHPCVRASLRDEVRDDTTD